MKNYKDILAQIKANNETVKALEEEAARLEKDNERESLRIKYGFSEFLKKAKELDATITEVDREKATANYIKANDLIKENKILQENARASFAQYAAGIIAEVFKKYNGKQYGPKTKAKIYEEARAAGIGFYLDGYGRRDTINAYPLNKDGYRSGSEMDVKIHARKENKPGEIVNEANTIINDYEALANYNKYTESATDTAEEIRKLYDELKEAAAKTREIQDKINALLPTKRIDAVNYIYDLRNYF